MPYLALKQIVLGELVRVSGSKNDVSNDLGVGNLANNIPVSEANNETVLGAVVLVLVLSNKASTGIVISFSFTPPAELCLVPHKVSFVFVDFNKATLLFTASF